MGCKILIPFIVITISANSVFADCPSIDLNGNYFVNFIDYALMANQWLIEYDSNDLNTLATQWLTGYQNIPDDMVCIPAGEFEMGDHFSPEGYNDELPLHDVLLDAFFMSKYEITNSQYCDYLNSSYPAQLKVVSGVVYATSDIGNNYPYCDVHSADTDSQIDFSDPDFSVRTKDGRDMSDDPVVCVSWYGAASYCNWRSSEEGYQQCYDPCVPNWPCDFSKKGHRLPTEAEWEYAARGGLSGKRFPWADPNISHSRANYYARPGSYPYDESPTIGNHPAWNDGIWPYTAPVGTFSANGYGLYDMAGNVWEWCNDWYDSNYYDKSPYDNPEGPTSGTYRVLRGGCWDAIALDCRVAHRFDYVIPFIRYSYIGFRVVLDLN